MNSIARLTQAQRSELFAQVANKRGMSEAVVEKDFWVCFTLNYLFDDSPYADSILFKGGTSLSKIHNLISRFSEDIDLILDWRIIGYELNEPWEQRSKTKQDKFNKECVDRSNLFLKETFIPAISSGLSELLGFEANIFMTGDDQTVRFAYPRAFESMSTLDIIRLEIGPLSAWTPFQTSPLTSYAAETYPNLFTVSSSLVKSVKPERTFWEKATILHQEFYRPECKPMPSRYARHYYDLYMLGHSEVADSALRDTLLLDRVREFKMRFYPTNWARLDLALPRSIKLQPPAHRLDELERDYKVMEDMFIGDVPSFDDLVVFVKELEARIHETDQID